MVDSICLLDGCVLLELYYIYCVC